MEGEEAAAPPPSDVPSTLEQGWVKGYYITETLPELESGLYKDVSKDAIWHICNARSGNGVEELMDDDLQKVWQTDGVAPHTVNIQLYRRHSLAEVCFYVDFRVDESYTPDHVVLRAGTTHQDLEEIRDIKLTEPSGWVRMPVGVKDAPGMGRYLRTWMVQLSLLSMHQNGRDAHVRSIKLLSPAVEGSAVEHGLGHAGSAGASSGAAAGGRATGTEAGGGGGARGGGAPQWLPAFTSHEMQQFADVR